MRISFVECMMHGGLLGTLILWYDTWIWQRRMGGMLWFFEKDF
jgi:hypothetical protein